MLCLFHLVRMVKNQDFSDNIRGIDSGNDKRSNDHNDDIHDSSGNYNNDYDNDDSRHLDRIMMIIVIIDIYDNDKTVVIDNYE